MSVLSAADRIRRYAIAITALLAVAAAPPPLAADAPTPAPIRLSTALSPSYPLGHAGERWAQLVNEEAGGAFEVRQYPGAALAQRDPAREFGALKDGLAELAVGSALAWSAQFPPLAVYAIPWLSPDAREQEALAADATLRERIFARMEAAGVVGLAIAPLGEHVIATTKAPVETPDDCKDLRIRVLAIRPVLEFYLTLGTLPQSMNYAQAQAALSGGTLDGQDTMATTLVATRAYASGQKFVTRWGAFSDVMVFAVSKASWDAWPPDRRALVRSAAEQAAREADALAREDAALAQLTKEGVTIVRLSPAQRAALRAVAQPAIATWNAMVGADLADAAQAVVSAAAK